MWAAGLAVGLACAVVWLAAPSPSAHHMAPARCTVSAPCYAGHQGGKLIGAYVLVRTARGLVRVPLRAARVYYRMRMMRGTGPIYLNWPSWGGSK